MAKELLFTDWEQVAKKPRRTIGMKLIASFSWQRSRSQLIGHGTYARWPAEI
jgi:hypothetical protein